MGTVYFGHDESRGYAASMPAPSRIPVDARPAAARQKGSGGLTTGTLVRYAAGSIGTGGFATLPGLVLLFFLTDTLGVSPFWAGTLVTVAKIWDVVIDPVIGARSDHSLAVTGSRRRFMLLGAVLLPVFFALTFAVPAPLGPIPSGIWVLIAFMLAATAFSLFQVPYIALPAELVKDYDARTRLLSGRVVVLTFAILLFGAGGPALREAFADERLGYLVLAIVAGLLLGAGMLVAVFSAPKGQAVGTEARLKTRGSIIENFRIGFDALRRSQPYRALLATFVLQAVATGMMLAGALYVSTWVLGTGVTFLFLSLIAPALICAPIWAAIARRIGKERAFTIATVIFGLAALSLVLLIPFPGEWLYGPVAIAGAAYAGMQALPMAMLPDVISHDARTHGPGFAGTFGGVWTAGETVGMALGAAVLSLVLAVSGYVQSVAEQQVTQTAGAITGIILSFSVVPAAFMAVSLITLARYRLRKGDFEADVK
jgi:glycoside/pentoside/hexuronide:cation symporter, GPH family